MFLKHLVLEIILYETSLVTLAVRAFIVVPGHEEDESSSKPFLSHSAYFTFEKPHKAPPN